MQPAPIVSPDGQFVWDGTEWVANPDAPQPTSSDVSSTSTTTDTTSSSSSTTGDPSSPTGTTPAPASTSTAAPAPAPAPASYGGPKVGSVVGYTFDDPYSDAEVTRYGLVIAGHAADPAVQGSTDRAEIAWLPEGTALLDVDELDQL